MSDVVASLGAVSPFWLLVTGGLLALAESALGLGFVLPGEAGIVSLSGIVDDGLLRSMLFVAVALGASTGDHLGYSAGRHFGPRLQTSRLVVRLGPGRWAAAMARIERRGAVAVFASRLVPVVRTIMPAAAGAAGLTYPRFLVASVAGALVWAGVWVGLGSFGGELVRLAGRVL